MTFVALFGTLFKKMFRKELLGQKRPCKDDTFWGRTALINHEQKTLLILF